MHEVEALEALEMVALRARVVVLARAGDRPQDEVGDPTRRAILAALDEVERAVGEALTAANAARGFGGYSLAG